MLSADHRHVVHRPAPAPTVPAEDVRYLLLIMPRYLPAQRLVNARRGIPTPRFYIPLRGKRDMDWIPEQNCQSSDVALEYDGVRMTSIPGRVFDFLER